MPKKMKKDGEASVHSDLKGFQIKVNEFGEMETNLPIDQLNDFLDKNAEDKKINPKQKDNTEEKQ